MSAMINSFKNPWSGISGEPFPELNKFYVRWKPILCNYFDVNLYSSFLLSW